MSEATASWYPGEQRSGAVEPATTSTSRQMIDVLQYEEEADFPVERGYFWNYCSSAENGNPLFWDDDVAAQLTDGPVAPPSMLSAWFRPHHWAPGRDRAEGAAPGALRHEGGVRSTRRDHERLHHDLLRADPPG